MLSNHGHDNFRATDERISLKVVQAATVWSMVDDITLGVGSAGSSAWVLALFSDASLDGWALRAGDALRSAVGRASEEVLLARADRVALLNNASRVRSTRRWVAGISWCFGLLDDNGPVAAGKWITLVARWARANRVVVDD